MDPNSSQWLMWIAIASITQVLLLLGAVITLIVGMRALQSKVEEIRREQLTPLIVRAHGVVDQAQDVIQKARAVTADVRAKIQHAEERVQHATSAVRSRVSPLIGVVRGVRAAMAALANGRPNGYALEKYDPEFADQSRTQSRHSGGTQHAH